MGRIGHATLAVRTKACRLGGCRCDRNSLRGAIRRAQTYPSAPVKVIVPFGAGGATDILARVFSERLQANLGQSFTVENRGGAAGQIAATAFSRSTPDGYTLMFATAAPITIAPQMNDKAQYDPRKDFLPVAVVAISRCGLRPTPTRSSSVRRTSSIWQGQIRASSPTASPASAPSCISRPRAVPRSAGIQMTHVPFRGGGEVINALLGNQIDFAALSTASIAAGLKQGTLRALAVSSPQRNGRLSRCADLRRDRPRRRHHVPWWGLMAPAGTPPAIVQRLTHELEAITQGPGRARAAEGDVRPDRFRRPGRIRPRTRHRDQALYGGIIRAANIKMGQ